MSTRLLSQSVNRRLAGSLLAAAAIVGQAAELPAISTKGGFAIESADGAYSFKAGGRIMWDVDSFDGVLNRANGGDRRSNNALRRARLETGGSVGGDWEYQFDIDLLDNASSAKLHTAGVRYTGFEAFDVFVGRTKEPFGLEELSSSKSLASIERNYYTEATDVDSQPQFGVRLDGKVGAVGWSAGLFNPVGGPQNSDGGQRIAFTGRVFGAPLNDDGQMLHLGAAFTDRNIDDPISSRGFGLDIAESGSVGGSGAELDSSSITIDSDRQFGLEALYITGPFSLQSEYFMRDMDGASAGPDGEVEHYYLQATYTITGEQRGYKPETGVPDIIKPANGDWAVELVAKVDKIEFDVSGAPTEEVTGVLVGVNLYPNRNVKLMADVIQVDSSNIAAPGDDDDALVISARLQLAF